MKPDEVQIQLDELETRIDRLRALYEQYFVGIEKTEPHVQKKDVERRFQVLRKIQIRNTALRFRFQALVQRYTTYLTYWQRICRRIEEGTFKRDVARAMRYGRGKPQPDGAETVHEIHEVEEIEEVEALEEVPDEAPAPAPVATPAPTPKPPPRPAAPSPAELAASREVRSVLASLGDLDEADAAPVRAKTSPLETAPARAPNAPPPTSPKPASPQQPVHAAPMPAARLAAASPRAEERPSIPPAFDIVERVSAPAAPRVPAPPTAPPAAAPSTAAPRAPAATAPAVTAPPVTTPPVTTATAPRVPAPPGPAPAAPAAPRRAGISPFGAPVRPKPAAATMPAAPAAATPPARPAGASEEPGMRDLYERYRAARQRNGEGDVSFDTVARQVRDTLPRLAEKYPDKQVSLDVVEKDGRTVLRPVVRPKD